MRKAKKTQKEEPCSRRQKLAKATGVPLRIAEVASLSEKDDDMALALIERLKVARESITPEQQANITKLNYPNRMAFIKKVLGEEDANLMLYTDIMMSYTLVKFLSSQEEK